MPTYEYRCTTNGRIVEVRHKMDELLRTWGELCERAGIDRDNTDARTPVEKLISAGYIGGDAAAHAEPACAAPACGSGSGGCGGGMCGLQ